MLSPKQDINDALGHPHLAAAMLHGGAHSVDEAAFHGKARPQPPHAPLKHAP
jgi:hypothetical protein